MQSKVHRRIEEIVMTIEEKAKEYASNVPDINHAKEYAEGSFWSGAKWMLSKAIDFIEQHDGEMIVCHTEDEKDSFLYEFRKAMEE